MTAIPSTAIRRALGLALVVGVARSADAQRGRRDPQFEQLLGNPSDFYVPPEKSLINETVVQPGELITSVFVPAPEPGTRSAYQKYGEKESFDWPLADVGVVLVMEGTHCRRAWIALGVAAPTPIRSAAAEAVLTGKTIDEATARAAASAAMQGATPLSQNGFKTQLFQTAIYRTVLEEIEADGFKVGGFRCIAELSHR